MKTIIVVLLFLKCTDAVTYSLQYFYTATSQVKNFPQFVCVGQVNSQQINYYDSISQNLVATQDQLEEYIKKSDPKYLERNTQNLLGSQQVLAADIDILKQRFNQTGGVHVYQNMYGCEWDDESGATEGFYQYGYDGEDFLSLDPLNMRWNAPVPQAVITKLKWDQDKADLEHTKNYLTKVCIDWLKKYLEYGKSSLQRKEPPKVSVFQRSSSSPVTCLATGFYPSGVMISWRKDGEDHPGEKGATLPNPDGTFQIRSTLNVSPEQLKNHKFDCVVDHRSLEKEMVTPWESGIPIALIAGIAVALVAVVAIILVGGMCLWRKNRKPAFTRANTDDGSNASSDVPIKS